jgi:hypothetical protein
MSGVSAITEWYAHRGVRAFGFLPNVKRACARYSELQLIGNGLEQLGYLSESKLTTRRFRNHLKSLGIFRPAYVDKSVLQFGKTQWRFDPAKSNSSFKYEFFKSGGTLAQLRTFPKRPYRPIVGYRDQSRGGRFARAHKTLPGAVVWKPKRSPKKIRRVGEKRGGNGPRQSVPNPGMCGSSSEVHSQTSRGLSKRAASRLVRAAQAVSDGNFVKVLGGLTVKAPPPGQMKKYTYFFRRNGFWYPSKHHPLPGDRESLFRVLRGRAPWCGVDPQNLDLNG